MSQTQTSGQWRDAQAISQNKDYAAVQSELENWFIESCAWSSNKNTQFLYLHSWTRILWRLPWRSQQLLQPRLHSPTRKTVIQRNWLQRQNCWQTHTRLRINSSSYTKYSDAIAQTMLNAMTQPTHGWSGTSPPLDLSWYINNIYGPGHFVTRWYISHLSQCAYWAHSRNPLQSWQKMF